MQITAQRRKIIGKFESFSTFNLCSHTTSVSVSFTGEKWMVIEKLARKLLNNNSRICLFVDSEGNGMRSE